jgi:hypothetical protein
MQIMATLAGWLTQGIGPFLGILLGGSLVTLVSAHVGPPANGTIHTCVGNSSGNIKITSATGTCGNNETPLDWNAQGPAGSQGPPGPPGPPGLSGLVVVTAETPSNNDQVKTISATCPTGKIAVSGGAEVSPIAPSQIPFLQLTQSKPVGGPLPTGWTAQGTSPSGFPTWKVVAYAVCASM